MFAFACHQVAAYLKDGLADEFDFAQVKKTIGDELKEVQEVVRHSMPSFFKDVWGSPAEETDAAKPETVEVTSEENGEGATADSVEERLAKLEGQNGNCCGNTPGASDATSRTERGNYRSFIN